MTPADIKNARLALGLSQTQMCKAMGLTSVMTYAKWEQGTTKPNASAISAIEMLIYMHEIGVIDGWIAKSSAK